MSVENMSPRGRQLAGAIAINFELLKEHAKTHFGEVLQLVIDMINHIRAWMPQALFATTESM